MAGTLTNEQASESHAKRVFIDYADHFQMLDP